jgi:hypothetical protein
VASAACATPAAHLVRLGSKIDISGRGGYERIVLTLFVFASSRSGRLPLRTLWVPGDEHFFYPHDALKKR